MTDVQITGIICKDLKLIKRPQETVLQIFENVLE